MTSESPNEAYGRGMRQTRQSRRAKEAQQTTVGLQKSGLPSASDDSLSRNLAATPPASRYIDKLRRSELDYYKLPTMTCQDEGAEQHATDRATPLSGRLNTRILQNDPITQQVLASIEAQEQNAKISASSDAVPTGFAQPKQSSSQPPIKQEKGEPRSEKKADSVQPPAKPQRVTKPQRTRQRRPAGEAQAKRKRAATPQANIQRFMTDDPILQPGKLQIYRWDHPVPKDFLNLPEDLKAAKARTDAAEAELDTDPELDDWHDFCGLESDLFSDLPLKSSIGLNFISRAKRAYRAGRYWNDFECEELAIDSRAGALALKDPVQRKIALSSSLSNSLRLYVFEQIKVPLCHEIWLQPYPGVEHASSKVDSAIGTAIPTPATSDKTALELATQRMAALPDRLQAMIADDAKTDEQVRTTPELPGRDRELHQPQGPRIRATQRNMRGLKVTYRDRLAGLDLDMETSEEE